MTTDFLDAHLRHVKDAEILLNLSHVANADQLFGFAAECGLKKLMAVFGMTLDADGSPADRADWVHAEKVWTRFESYRSSHASGSGYVLSSNNPFGDWHARQRYAHSNVITLPATQLHRTAALEVSALIKKAQLEGFI